MLVAWAWIAARAVLILVVGVLIGSWLAGRTADELARGGADPELRARIVAFVDRALTGVAILVAIASLGAPMGPVLLLAGGVALFVGLVARDPLANAVAGVWMLQVRPFRVGDVIEVGGERGTVVAIGGWATTLVDHGGTRVLPNRWIMNRPVRIVAPTPAT